MRIGDFNLFEVYSSLDSVDVGDMNEFQCRSIVPEGCKVESFCQVNACIAVPKNTYLQNYTVVYEDGGKMMQNLEFNEEAKKTTIKDLCACLLEQLPKHNKAKDN